jgi:hypothetical protein
VSHSIVVISDERNKDLSLLKELQKLHVIKEWTKLTNRNKIAC